MKKLFSLFFLLLVSAAPLSEYNEGVGLLADGQVDDALLKFEVDKGLSGATPGSPAPYAAVGHLYFNSLPEFAQAFAPHAGEIMADVPNYTDAQAQVQISEIVAG